MNVDVLQQRARSVLDQLRNEQKYPGYLINQSLASLERPLGVSCAPEGTETARIPVKHEPVVHILERSFHQEDGRPVESIQLRTEHKGTVKFEATITLEDNQFSIEVKASSPFTHWLQNLVDEDPQRVEHGEDFDLVGHPRVAGQPHKVA